MEATLIKLETKVVNIPDHRPFWREIVRDNIPLSANYDGMDLSSAPNTKTIDYRMVEIRGGNKGENGYYMINDEMWYKAIPLLEDIIENRLTYLKKENRELNFKLAILKDELIHLRSLWFVKIYNWIRRKMEDRK